MTEPVRRREFTPIRTPVDPAEAGPEQRMGRWETEYLVRYPGREVDPRRLGDGV